MTLTFHNSATVRAAPRFIDKSGGLTRRDFPIRFGLFHHATRGLVLVDTGYSDAIFRSLDMHVKIYRNLLRPKLRADGDALAVVSALGAKAKDVRHILLSHLHADHMCGLERFPLAQIHASAASLQGWRDPTGFSHARKGFFPSLLPHLNDRNVFAVETASSVLLPFGGVGFDIFGDGSVIAVDLPGHMKGHVGWYFPKFVRPHFYAADADWTIDGLLHHRPLPFAGRLIIDNTILFESSKKIAQAAQAQGLRISLSHDDALG